MSGLSIVGTSAIVGTRYCRESRLGNSAIGYSDVVPNFIVARHGGAAAWCGAGMRLPSSSRRSLFPAAPSSENSKLEFKKNFPASPAVESDI